MSHQNKISRSVSSRLDRLHKVPAVVFRSQGSQGFRLALRLSREMRGPEIPNPNSHALAKLRDTNLAVKWVREVGSAIRAFRFTSCVRV